MTIEKHTRAPRAHVLTSGNFHAVPQGFEGGKGSLRYILKPEFQVVPASDDNSRATMAVPREHALLDLAAVNLADLDAATIIRDCEIVAKAARELRRLAADHHGVRRGRNAGVASRGAGDRRATRPHRERRREERRRPARPDRDRRGVPVRLVLRILP